MISRMRERLQISPHRYAQVTAVALAALALIVLTGAAVDGKYRNTHLMTIYEMSSSLLRGCFDSVTGWAGSPTSACR